MWANYDEALTIYNMLPAQVRTPENHPEYVQLDTQRNSSLTAVYYVYREQDSLYYHALHESVLPDGTAKDLQSAYGYGGPVTNDEDPAFLARAWQAYLTACMERRILAEFIRFDPLLRNDRWYGGNSARDRSTVWIDLAAGMDSVWSEMSGRARTSIRKAEKENLSIREIKPEDTEGWKRFKAIYEETMGVLDADSFYLFTEDYFKGLAGYAGQRLLVAEKEGELLAASLFLRHAGRTEYHLSASRPAGKRIGASNLLLAEAIRRYGAEGAQCLHLGGGTDGREDNPLLFFKRGFSQRRAEFRIGWFVHERGRYDAMKGAWEKQFGKRADRILFYRFGG